MSATFTNARKRLRAWASVLGLHEMFQPSAFGLRCLSSGRGRSEKAVHFSA